MEDKKLIPKMRMSLLIVYFISAGVFTVIFAIALMLGSSAMLEIVVDTLVGSCLPLGETAEICVSRLDSPK